MLSDKTIYRDKPHSLKRRVVNFIRKSIGRRGRKRINQGYRELLAGLEFSVFSNNCLGGKFLRDADKQFRSPTVNMAFDGEEFVAFLEKPRHYLNAELRFVKSDEVNYPVAMLDGIELRFVHYKSEEDCVAAWRRRSERILWDRLLVIATDHDGMGKPENLERFDKLPYNKVMFTSQRLPQYAWAVTVPQFEGREQVDIMTLFANIKGERHYESCFDLAGWVKACCEQGSAEARRGQYD